MTMTIPGNSGTRVLPGISTRRETDDFAQVIASVQAAAAIAAPYSKRVGDATGATDPDRVDDAKSCREITDALAPAGTMMIELAQTLRAALPATGDDQDDEAVRIMLGGHLVAMFRTAFGIPLSGFEDGYSFVDAVLFGCEGFPSQLEMLAPALSMEVQ